jgi:hypothetical protein
MKIIFISILAILLLLLSVFSVNAQILVTRNYTIDPFVDSTTTKKVLGISAFHAEFSRGNGSTANAHAWNARIAGLFEIYRFSPNTSFVFTTAHEITADLYNSLYFNPKGAIWHETFSVFHRRKKLTFEVGVSHRCRHNIDNADTDDGDTISTRNITYRVLILNAPFVNVFTKPIKIAKNLELTTSLRGEYFWYSYDSRYPYIDNSQLWANMKASLHATLGINYHFHHYFAAYTKVWGQAMFFKTKETFNTEFMTNNYRIESGIMLKGEKANLQVFASYEYFFDDYSRHIPRTSGVMFIGARLGGKVFR